MSWLLRWPLLAALAIAGSGCAGTCVTRVHASPIGGYPYEAVAVDGAVVVLGGRGVCGDHPVFHLIGLLSIPFDLVVDTVLLPADLVAWPLGHHKSHVLGHQPAPRAAASPSSQPTR